MDRRKHMPKRIASLLFAFWVLVAPRAFADTIVSVTGTGVANYTLGGDQDEALEASWTTFAGYSNVSIMAEVGSASASSTITAYLTTAIGPTDTAADQIASLTFAPATDNEVDTLFSGLSLGPDTTYYLVLIGGDSDSTESAWWGTDAVTGATVDNGVTFGGDDFAAIGVDLGVNNTNPPASAFNSLPGLGLLFQVTGDAESTPEPDSFSLVLTGGLAGLWLWKHRRQRQV
jgi:hypothetical protein